MPTDAWASVAAELARRYQPPTPGQWPTPGHLAKAWEPTTRQTAALDLLDAKLVDVQRGDIPRLMWFMPPQEGKSQRVSRWFPSWLLSEDPTLRIAIVSFEQERAVRWGRQIKRDLEGHPSANVRLAPDAKAAGRWNTTRGGGVYCVGIGGALTGEPVDVLIIDDPVKGRAEAESKTYRDAAWDWWESVAETRLSTRGRVVLIMCMTGDTPVLMANGTERPLRDIRPGDAVATYEGGRLTTSTVKNWANQGPDELFRVKMKSGRVVRANARHPFLTIDQNGTETWLRTDQIRPGVRILTATGGSGEESPARLTDATVPPGVRGCVTPTTTKLCGHRATGHLRSMLRHVAGLASSIATDSLTKRSTSSSTSRAASALYVGNRHRATTPAPTGTGSSASIMTTRQAECAAYSATTATSPSGTENRRKSSVPPLTTWNVTPDEVVSVEPCGAEDVFDLQIDRTENFIANGLVSHNTRWHEDDLAGRLLRHEPGEWDVVRVRAVAEDDDPLGRNPGDELVSAQQRKPGHFKRLEQVRSDYVWRSVYQQSPTAAKGNLFLRDRWRFHETVHDPSRGRCADLDGRIVILSDSFRFCTVDLAASTRNSADFTVACAWAIGPSGDLVLLDRVKDRVAEGDHWGLVRPLMERWRLEICYVESRMFGTTLVYEAGQHGVPVQELHADTDKLTRALPAVARVKARKVWLPRTAHWLDDWIDEHAEFPSSEHDDQVDNTAYAARVQAAHVLAPESGEVTDMRRAMKQQNSHEMDLMTVAY